MVVSLPGSGVHPSQEITQQVMFSRTQLPGYPWAAFPQGPKGQLSQALAP